MSGDFVQAYDDQVGSIYGFFAYRVRCRSDAEDLTQRTFERAWRAWRRFDPQRAPVRIWLLAIARNVLVDHYRGAASSLHEPLDHVEEERLGIEQDQPDLGLDPTLARALSGLSPRDREILALRFGADLSGPEIAELTGLTVGNVQQVISRSLRKLRAALGEDASPARRSTSGADSSSAS